MSLQTSAPIIIADEIARILESPKGERERLEQIVSHLKRATNVDVCTLYRRSQKGGHLYIEFTDGLAKSRIGQLALKRGEGLTGLVVESRKPLPVRDGPSHPNFQFIPGLMEEAFHSYLGVPLLSGNRAVGALVVQTKEPRDFSLEDVALLKNIARQICPLANKVFEPLDQAPTAAKSASSQRRKKDESKSRSELRGRSLAPGCFMGPPFVLDHGMTLETVMTPPSRGVEEEIKAIRRANRIVMADLERDARKIAGSQGHEILMAHKIMLEDVQLAEEVLNGIRAGASASEAVRDTGVRWIHRLQNIPDPVFAARAADFRDIANRLMAALGIASVAPSTSRSKIVALSRNLLPGDLLRLGAEKVGAIIMTDQGMYSHTAILARSFGIPAVQVSSEHLDSILHAKKLLVDGSDGLVVADPSPEKAKEYFALAERMTSLPEGGPKDLTGPVKTVDGVSISVGLNAGLFNEFDGIEKVGPDEIGLYRTELAYMSHDRLPGWKQQAVHYRKVLAAAAGRRVVFRTFDFGGDKLPDAFRFDREENPMMGYRSTRFMLGNVELFRAQLRAMLVASAHGSVSILLPMIATPEELNLALDELNTIKNELAEEGVEFDPDVKVGIMLEVPSVLFQIDELSRASDFFCIGTNDLLQYLMAADRSNARVTWLYQWHHPAALVALDRLIRHCKRNKRPVSVCGEMSSNPWAAMLLVGMGCHQLSMDCHSIPAIKWVLMQCSEARLRSLATKVMRATSSNEVVEILFGALEDIRIENPPLWQLLNDSLRRLHGHAQW